VPCRTGIPTYAPGLHSGVCETIGGVIGAGVRGADSVGSGAGVCEGAGVGSAFGCAGGGISERGGGAGSWTLGFGRGGTVTSGSCGTSTFGPGAWAVAVQTGPFDGAGDHPERAGGGVGLGATGSGAGGVGGRHLGSSAHNGAATTQATKAKTRRIPIPHGGLWL